MQLMIDPNEDSPEQMRIAAKFLADLADSAEEYDNAVTIHDDPRETPRPPVPAVDIPPALAVPPPAPTADLDVDGKTWDAEVHSSSKNKTIDGRWKVKHKRNRGESDVVVPPVPTPIPPPPTVSPPAVDDADDSGEPASVPASDGAVGLTFQKFIPLVTGAMNAGTLTQDKIHEVQTLFNIPALMALSSAKPEVIEQVAAALGLV